MTKKETSSTEKVKFIFLIILGSITIGGTLFAVERHFAKTNELKDAIVQSENGDKSLEELIDISITNSEIFRQEQIIQRIEDIKRFEQKKEEPDLTPIEKEMLSKAKKRLEKLEIRKEEKIKHYEDGVN